MRFCFIASRDWLHPDAAGGDYYLGNLARRLVARGHGVTLLVTSFDGSTSSLRLDGVKILRIKPGLFFPIRLFSAYMGLRSSIDVLVEEVFGGKKIPSFALFYPSRLFVAVWYQRHERIFSEQYPPVVAKILGLVERMVARVYRSVPVATLSHKSAAELAGLGLDPSKIGIVPSAALMSYPGVDEIPPFAEREDVMVFIGKIRKYKRVDHTILALKKLQETGQSVKLVIAGNVAENDAAYLSGLRSLTSRYGLDGMVEFRIYSGAIPQREKVALLKRCKILLQPSPVEGFSMTTVEANACGTPVVVSDGVPRDAVEPGCNGLVYPFGDIETMSKSCRSLFEEPDTWENMSAIGLKLAQRFSWDLTAESFEEFVKKQVTQT